MFTFVLAIVMLVSMTLTAYGDTLGGHNQALKDTQLKKTSKSEYKILDYYLWNEPETLDFHKMNFSYDLFLANTFMEGLVRFGKEDGKYEPGVAKTWNYEEDNMTWTFQLREDAKWKDGTPITAHDFEFGWKLAMDNQGVYTHFLTDYIDGASEYASLSKKTYLKEKDKDFKDLFEKAELEKDKYKREELMSKISDRISKMTNNELADYKKMKEELWKNVGVKGEGNKFSVKLKINCPYFIGFTPFAVFYPVNEKFYNKHINNAINTYCLEAGGLNSNGPWIVEEWKHNEGFKLVKNENYWNKENIKIDEINLIIIEDGSVSTDLLKIGAIDLLPINSKYINSYKDKRVNKLYNLKGVVESADYGFTYITLNQKYNKILKNENIRKALAYAMDRKTYCEKINPGDMYSLAIIPENFPGLEKSFREENGMALFEDNQKEMAKEYLKMGLKELGLEKLPPLEFVIESNNMTVSMAKKFQEDWSKVGIDINLITKSWTEKSKILESGDFDLCMSTWGPDYMDPMTYLEIFETNNEYNSGKYSNSEYDNLIKAARSEKNMEKRMKMLYKAEKHLIDNMALIPIFSKNKYWVHKKYLSGVVYRAVGPEPDFYWADIDMEEKNRHTKNISFKYNLIGKMLMDKGKVNEAVKFFNRSLDNLNGYENFVKEAYKTYNISEDLFDTPFNNLSWAYNELGEYEKSLEYIEQSLRILPNEENEYVNKGNALYALGRYEDALQSFDKAISKNTKCDYAYFGKGLVYLDNEKYDKALIEFNNCLKYAPNDLDAKLYKVLCHLYSGDKSTALEYINKLIDEEKNNSDVYEVKGIVLEYTSGYEEVIEYYEEVCNKFPENYLMRIKLGELYYNLGNYNKSLEHYLKLLDGYPGDLRLYADVAYNYSALNELDKAVEYCNSALSIDKSSSFIYNVMGNIYGEQTLYVESVEYFEKAIELLPTYKEAYLNKLYALYSSKRYSKCIEFGKKVEKQFKDIEDLHWLMGESYSKLNKIDEAIKEYEKVVEKSPKSDGALASIALSYCNLENYDKGKEYMDRALKMNPQNSTALYISSFLSDREQPITEQVEKLVTDEYLYFDNSVNLKDTGYLNNKDMSNKEIAELIEKIKDKDDRFTFVIYGDYYDQLKEEQDNDIEFKNIDENTCYVKIKTFSINTDNKFIDIVDGIEDTEDKTLVIDLRSNMGGLTKSANNILDVLLPECVTSTVIYKDGYTYNYYSDASQIKFKNIYVLVDENTASSSEIVSLGLKTYLNNVTIVGRETVGKGVGQYVYEDKKRKLLIFIVNHYWNVRQTNIMNNHITPDVRVEGDDLKEFLKVINKGN